MPEPNCFFGHPEPLACSTQAPMCSGREGIDCRQAQAGSEHQRFPTFTQAAMRSGVWFGINHYQNNMRSWDVIMKQFAGRAQLLLVRRMRQGYCSSEFANMSLYPPMVRWQPSTAL